MCWVTFDRKNTRFRQASEDIPVYKVVKKSLLSYYENYAYILNEVHTTVLDHPSYNGHNWGIRLGFHSYSTNCKVDLPNGKTSLFVRILKSYNNLAIDWYEREDTCMLECIIPKDSMYFLNDEGEYVSDHILPLKVRNW